jgi:hypothetical protein
MKALSIRAPFAWAIFHAGKNVENRSWRTHLRGTVAIHASQTLPRWFYENAVRDIKRLSPRANVPSYDSIRRAAIIGVVDIVGCEKKKQSKWHERGNYGFILTRPRLFRTPISCPGSLGFWNIPPAKLKKIPKSARSRKST